MELRGEGDGLGVGVLVVESDVDPGFRRGEQAGDLPARDVVPMHKHRAVERDQRAPVLLGSVGQGQHDGEGQLGPVEAGCIVVDGEVGVDVGDGQRALRLGT